MNERIQQIFTRPIRQKYYSYDLGPQIFFVNDNRVIRNDFTVVNDRGHKLMVSFYQYQSQHQESCVIYLHTHHGSRLEGTPLVEPILKRGLNICLFDFAGYGNSEGDSVTLGINQMQDIQVVIKHLQSQFKQKKIVLWGRSMGAVTALLFLYHRQNSSVVGGVYDSPFYSLEKLTLELGSKNTGLPQLILKPFIYWLKKSLRQQIDFSKLQLSSIIQDIRIPGVFITSKDDKFVDFSHAELLYKDYSGKKELFYIERDHNQTRKQSDLEYVFKYVRSITQTTGKKWRNILNNHFQYMNQNTLLYQQNIKDIISECQCKDQFN